MFFLRNIPLYFHTVRYLTLKQIAYRARAMIRRKWWRITKKKAPKVTCFRAKEFQPLLKGIGEICPSSEIQGASNAAVERAVSISQGRFSFINQEVHYERGIDWHDSHVSQLWRYNLHYFDYVEDLMLWAGQGHSHEAWDVFRKLAASWISLNEKLEGDGWHPFTLSLRMVNWVNAFGYWRSHFEKDSEFSACFLSSLHAQARFLTANLEHDVRGNHLLKNLKGLLWAGKAFEGEEARGLISRALRVLRKELAEQVLDDGGHFERVPGYHGIVLADCMEMALWLRRNGGHVPEWLDGTIKTIWDRQIMLTRPEFLI